MSRNAAALPQGPSDSAALFARHSSALAWGAGASGPHSYQISLSIDRSLASRRSAASVNPSGSARLSTRSAPIAYCRGRAQTTRERLEQRVYPQPAVAPTRRLPGDRRSAWWPRGAPPTRAARGVGRVAISIMYGIGPRRAGWSGSITVSADILGPFGIRAQRAPCAAAGW